MPVENQLRRRFGENLKGLRLARGHTQEALAERCQLSVDAIRRIEWGSISPSLDTLGKLAGGLNISLQTMFATFERKRRDEVAELADLMSRRTPKEARRLAKVAKILFED